MSDQEGLSDVACPRVDVRTDAVNLDAFAVLYGEAVEESIGRYGSNQAVQQKIVVLHN